MVAAAPTPFGLGEPGVAHQLSSLGHRGVDGGGRRLPSLGACYISMQTTPSRRVLQLSLSAAVLCAAAAAAYHLAVHRPVLLAILLVGLSLLPKVRTLVALIVHTSAAIVLIEIDRVLPFPLPFPRSPDELIRTSPRRLLDAASSACPDGSKAIGFERTASPGVAAALEPDKACSTLEDGHT